MFSLVFLVCLTPTQDLGLGGPEAEKLKELIATGGINRRAAPKPLGHLSKKYEVSNGGPETISSGKIYDKKSKKQVDDPGGVSYGSYQFASLRGIDGSTVKAFVAKYFAKEFAGLELGTKQFDEQWVKSVLKDVVKFRQLEHEFIKTTHYDPVVASVKEKTGLNVAARSRTLQDVVWSTAVQHGPPADNRGHAVPLLEKALGGWSKDELTKSATAKDNVDDADIIKAVYDERARKKEDGKMVYFPTISDLPRFNAESSDALKNLAAERQSAAKKPNTNPPSPSVNKEFKKSYLP